MEKVDFNLNDQSKLRGLSKAIYIISKVCRIFTWIGVVCMAIGMIFVPYVINRVDIKDNVITVKGLGNFSLNDLDIDIKSKDEKIAKDTGEYVIGKVGDILEGHSKTEIILFIEGGLLLVEASMIISVLILKRLEKLFKNISELDSPFIEENVELTKKIAQFLIASLVLSCVTSLYLDIITNGAIDININFITVMGILIVFVIMYIFKYGCTLQEKSKKKIYEDSSK